MTLFIAPLLVISLLAGASPAHGAAQSTRPGCSEWQTCRDLAEQARAAGDFDAFHDLAWRAVQTRGKRDPDLFFLLARAQSLSGRPNDAIVTLQRLAQEMHVAKDVSADEDFRRVRALPGWPEVQAMIEAEARGQAATGTETPDVSRQGAEVSGGEPGAGAARPNQSAEPDATNRRNPLSEPTIGAVEEVARFAATSFVPGGMAYDAVSRRFVIGNLPARKLTIVEEGTNRAATLSGDAAQLLNVRALEIDRSQGDLWVVSEGSREGSAGVTSELHKLQLVSGRVLTIYTADANTASHFVDVALGRGNGVLVLDAAGPRLLKPTTEGRTLTPVMDLPAGEVTSLAPTDDGRTVYVAYADHIARVDLNTRHVDRVSGEVGELANFSRLRWHKGSLLGAQLTGGKQRIVQLRLSRTGNRVVGTQTLDDSDAPATSLAALDVLENDFFYLVPGAPQASIRRIRLK